MTDGLPNLLVVGVPKAGTGSLFAYLAQHPDICPATTKEVRFFNHLVKGGTLPDLDGYRRYFAHCEGQRYRLEATPGYCFGGEAVLQAIKTNLNRPRIIMILREPVDRLWSAYNFQRASGRLSGIKSFEDYIAACENRRAEGRNITRRGPFNGLSIGFYADYVEAWFDEFQDDIRAVFFDDLATDPRSLVTDLCQWLTIDSHAAATFDYAPRNKTQHPRNLSMIERAFPVKKRAGALLKRSPRVRSAVRKVYWRVNNGEPQETLQPRTRSRLEALYGPSTGTTAALLRSQGYGDLPSWLAPDAANRV